MTLTDTAKAFGATGISLGINWTWATGFPTAEAAWAFIRSRPMDHRGVYPNKQGTFDVRFRYANECEEMHWHWERNREKIDAVENCEGNGI